MRGINYQAAFGTILLFGGFYCFKAVLQKSTPQHGSHLKTSIKILLIASGIAMLIAGGYLLVRAVRSI